MPAAGFGLVALLLRADALPDDRLSTLVMLIEFAVPSAQMPIVVLQQLGEPAMAGNLARPSLIPSLCTHSTRAEIVWLR